MKRKQTNKNQTHIKFEEAPPSDEEEGEQTPSRKGRQDNSLSVLTKKFIQLIKYSQNCTIDLNQAVEELKVQKRRIYDITNVLEGINYVQKLHKNTIKWIGSKDDPETEKQILEIKLKLAQLNEEEKELDKQIAELNGQIQSGFLQNQEFKPFHYITYDDCLNIWKQMSKNDSKKGMLVVSAPKGTTLEVSEEQKGECVLKMDANGRGQLKLFSCKQEDGVQKVETISQSK